MLASGEQSEFNPFNPFDEDDDESGMAFFSRIHELKDGPEYFRGSADLLRLVRDRVLGVGVTIRCHDRAGMEFWTITKHGLIDPRLSEDSTIMKRQMLIYPFSELDSDPLMGGRPYIWGVYGWEPISDQSIDQIFVDSPSED